MEYYQFLFESLSQDKKDILVALLNEIGFTGFEEEESELKASIAITDYSENLFKNIIKVTKTKYSLSILKEKNWNAEWEENFEPIVILHPLTNLPFAKVRASFHEAGDGMFDIMVTPKMSFGTGHHATTHLMIERMSLQSFQNKTVIDFGTGTGVLAILAEKMGAVKVDAIDNDDWSINNAKENFAANHCHKIILHKADNIPGGKKADIVLANINLNVIVGNLNEIVNACETEAKLLFSGFLTSDKEIILKALEEKEIEIINCFEKNNWLVIESKYKKI